MNRYNLIPLLILLVSHSFYSQIGIGTTNPAPSSALDISSNTHGVLIPRLSTTERDVIVTPAFGLIIYNTTTSCNEFYTGTAWYNLCFHGITDSSSDSNGTAVVEGYNCQDTPTSTPTGTLIKSVPAFDVSQTVIANVTTVGTYDIKTTINGIAFSDKGTFTEVGYKNIVLKATGTPLEGGVFTFAINTVPNCEFNRTVFNETSGGTSVISITDCSTVSRGTLIKDLDIPAGVEQDITLDVTNAGTYNIKAFIDGVLFSAEGTLVAGTGKTITLKATGKPTVTGVAVFVLQLSPSCTFNRDILVPITITKQPVAPAAICSGKGTQILTVEAKGTGLTYTWRKEGTAAVNGNGISGQGTKTLTLTNPAASLAGSYDVIISNGESVTSTAVAVTINESPTITSAPAVERFGKGEVTLSAVSSSTTLKWYETQTAAVPLSSLNPYIITIDKTTTFYVEATSTLCTSVTRTTIEAKIKAPVITSQPQDKLNFCSGIGTETLTVVDEGATSYVWKKGGLIIEDGTIITGQGTARLTITNPTVSETGSYQVDVINSAGTITSSPPSVVSVYAIPTIAASTDGIISYTTGVARLTATPSAGVVDWYSAQSGGEILATGTIFTTPVLVSSTTYYAQANNSGCLSATRTAVKANIEAPTITVQPVAAEAVCSGNGTQVMTVSATGFGVLTYTWRKDGVALVNGGVISGQGTATLTLTNPVVANAGSYDVIVSNGVDKISTAVTVSVKEIPTFVSTAPAARCGTGEVTLGATVATGVNVKWYAALTGGTALGTGINFNTGSISTNTTYYAEAEKSGCVSTPRTAVVATINALPTITVTNASRCDTGSVTLAATSAGATIKWYSDLTTTTELGTGTSYDTGNINITTTYYVEAVMTATGCKSAPRTAVTATINTMPTIITTTPGYSCGTGTVTLSATATAGATLKWYANSTGGSSLGDGNSFITANISTTTTYYVEAEITGCSTATRTAVIATMKTVPTIISTTPTTICGAGPASIEATATTGATIKWYAGLTGGTALVTGAIYNLTSISSTTTYYAEAELDGCLTVARAAVIATVNTIPTITGTTPAANCGSGSVSLSATAATGTDIKWYANLIGGTALSTGSTYNTSTISTTTTYYVEAELLGCVSASPRTAVIATINIVPTVTATTPKAICGTGTVTLGATSSGTGVIKWYANSTGGSSLFTGATYTTVSLTTTTTYYAEAVIEATGCASAARTAVVATINAVPTIASTTAGKSCGVGTVTLGATPSLGATIKWYDSLTDGTLLFEGNSFTTANLITTTTFYAEAVIASTSCAVATREAVVATISPIPVILTTVPNKRCGTGTVTLGATATSGTTVNWYEFSTGGTALGTAESYVTESISATTTYYLEAELAGCKSSPRTEIVATVNAIPIILTTTPDKRCGAGVVTLAATASAGATIKWYADLTGLTSLVTGASYTTESISSTTTYYVEASTALCASTPRTAVIATINNIPSITNTVPKTRCGPGTVDLTATASVGATIKWYANSTGGTALGAGESYTTANLAINTTYYVEAETTECVSTPRVAIVATINSLPTLTTTSGAVCGSGTAVLTATTSAGAIIKWYAGIADITEAGTGTSFTTGNITTTTTYYAEAEISTTGCKTTPRTPVDAVVKAIPTITSTDASVCGSGQATLRAVASGGATIKWWDTLIDGAELGTGENYTTGSISTTTIYYVSAEAGGCVSTPRTAVTATVNTVPTLSNPIAGSRCGIGTVTLSATASAGATIKWYAGLADTTELSTGASYITESIGTTTTYYASAVIIATGCTTTPRTEIIATIKPIPAITAVPGSVCGKGTVTLSATATAGATLKWYDALTGGTLLGTGVSYNTASISTTTTYYAEAEAAGCIATPRTAVVATVNEVPTITNTTPGSVCGTGTVTLGATASAGAVVKWYPILVGGTELVTGTSYTTVLISSSTSYYAAAEIIATGCQSIPRTAVLATVNETPTIITTTPGSVCLSGSVTLTASATAGAIIKWYDALTGGTELGTGTTFNTGDISSTTTYYVGASITSTGCEIAQRQAVVATVNAVPTLTVTPGSTCGTGSVLLGAATTAGATIKWYHVLTDGTVKGMGTTFNSPVISIPTTYYVEAQLGGCITSPRTPVLATPNPVPTISSTTPGSVCGTGAVNLSATASAGSILKWYAAITGGAELGTGTSFSTGNISSITTYYVDAVITATGCTAEQRQAVIATVNPIPTLTLTPGYTCGPGSVSLGAVASDSATINWYLVSTGGTVQGTGTTFNTGNISTTTTYYVDATAAGCTTSSRAPVIATVSSIPTVTLTPNKRCGTGTVDLTAASSTDAVIKWYAALTGGTSIGTGSTFNTGSITTTTTYYADAQVGNCTSAPRTAVIATINSIPTITSTVSQSRCDTGTVSLGATPSVGASIKWYADLTGGTALGTGTTFTTPDISTTTTYYVEALTSECTSSPRTAIIATVNTMPGILSSTNGTRCGSGVVALGATSTAGATIKWYADLTGGTELGTGPAFNTPSITSTITYYAEALYTGCTSTPRTTVIATVNAIPTITNTVAASNCGTGVVTLTATPSAGATIKWYDVLTGGTSLISGASYTTEILTSSTTFYAGAEAAGCVSTARTPVIATIKEIPSIVSTIPNSRCGAGVVNLAGTPSNGATTKWYANLTGGTALYTGDTFTTESISTTTNYYVEAELAGCTSTARTAVEAIVNASPSMTTTPGFVCGSGAVTLAATVPVGTTVKWYSLLTGGIALGSANTYTTVSISTSTTYYAEAEVTATGCKSTPREAVVATVKAKPTITPISNSVCGSGQVVLGATASGSATIKWFDSITNGAELGTGTSYTTGSLNITTTFYVEAEAGGCTSLPRTAVVATVNEMPTLTTTTNSVCGAGTINLSASPSAGATVKWYDTLIGGTVLGTNNSFTTPGISTTTTYYVEAVLGGCSSSPRTAVVATVIALPTITATPNSVCGTGVVTLGATSPGATIKWYDSLTNGTLLTTGNSFTTGNISSTTTYYVEAVLSGCSSSPRTAIVATVNPLPTITNNTPNSRCGAGTVTLAGTASAGAVVKWYDALTNGNFLFEGASYNTVNLSTTTTYYAAAEITVTSCSSATRTAVVATVNALPTLTTTSNFVCGPGTVTLSVTPSAGATVKWYDTLTGGTVLGTSNSFTTPSISTTITYYAEAVLASCASTPRTAVVATVSELPTLTTTPNSICGTGTVTLTATASAGASTKWYDSLTNGTLLTTGNSYTTPSISSTITYYVEAVLAGCSSSPRTAVVATVNTLPTLTTTPNSVCGTGTVTLSATPSAGATVKWYDTLTGGTVLGTSNSFTTPSISTTTTYYVEAVLASCASTPRTAVVATVNELPTLTTTPNSICGTGTATLNATPSAGATVKWYDSLTNGTLLTTGNSYTTPSISSTITYYVEAVLAGCSSSPRTAVVATVNTLPTLTTTPNSVCGTGTVTLSATPSAGATVKWYDTLTGGTVLGTSNSFTTPSISTTTTYYVEAVLASCASTPRTAVVATVNELPTLTTTPNSICGTGTVTLTAMASAGASTKWYDTLTGGTVLGTNNSFTTGTISSTTTYYVEAVLGGCASTPRTAVVATVNEMPTLTTTPNSVCGTGTVTLSATPSAGATVKWYDTLTVGTLLITGNSYTTPIISTTTTYYVEAVLPGCRSTPRTPIVATVYPLPLAPSALDATTVCANKGATLTATPYGIRTVVWYNSGGTELGNGTPFTTPNISTTTTFYAGSRSAEGCVTAPGSRASVIASVNPLPIAPTNLAATLVCGSGTSTLTATGNGSDTIVWYHYNEIGTGSPYTTFFTLSGSDYTFYAGYRDSYGCETETSNRASVIARVVALPAKPTNVSATHTCGSGPVILTATQNGTNEVVWCNGAGTVLGVGTPYTTPSLSVSTVYYAGSRNADGCVTHKDLTQPISAPVYPLPPAPSMVSATPVCVSGSSTLSGQEIASHTIIWYNSGGTEIGSGTPVTSPTISTTTTFYAGNINSYGCDLAPANRVPVTATVTAGPCP